MTQEKNGKDKSLVKTSEEVKPIEVAVVQEGEIRFSPMPLVSSATLPPLQIDPNLVVEQVKGQLSKKLLDHYAYSFKVAGLEARGLTWQAVNVICGVLGNHGYLIREAGYPQVTFENDQYVEVSGVAQLIRPLGLAENKRGEIKPVELVIATSTGSRRQEKKKKRRDGTEYDVNFPYENAVTKAFRKAKEKLIPEEIRVAILDYALKTNKTKAVPTEEEAEDADNGNEDVEKHKKKVAGMFAELKKKYSEDGEARLRRVLKDDYQTNTTKDLTLFQIDVLIQRIKTGEMPEPNTQESLV